MMLMTPYLNTINVESSVPHLNSAAFDINKNNSLWIKLNINQVSLLPFSIFERPTPMTEDHPATQFVDK